MTPWLLLTILSALFLGFYDVAKKAALEDNAVIPVLFCCSLVGMLVMLPAGILSMIAPELAGRCSLLIVPISPLGHWLVVAKAGIVTLSWVLTYFALKHLPISLAAPLRASAPLFVLLGAVLLFGERPSALQWLGIAAVLVSYWLFALLGRAEGIHFSRNLWVWLLFAGTLVGAASGLYDKHLMQSAHLPPLAVQFWFSIYSVLLQGVIALVGWWPNRKNSTPFVFRGSIVAVGALLIVSDNLYLRALAAPLALISVVSIVRRSNVVVSFAVGGIAFRERNRLRKAGALAGLLVGIGLLLA